MHLCLGAWTPAICCQAVRAVSVVGQKPRPSLECTFLFCSGWAATLPMPLPMPRLEISRVLPCTERTVLFSGMIT